MYYLQSRYYNPEWGRFINGDAIIGQTGELLGHNMFAYCKNNPVNLSDPNGYSPIAIMLAGALIGGGFNLVTQLAQGNGLSHVDWKAVGASALGGAIAALPYGGLLGAMAFGAVGNIVSNGLQGNINSIKDAAYYGSIGAAVNAAGFGVAKAVEKKAAQSFEQLGRQAQRVKLQSIYGDTSRKVLNSKMNADVNFNQVLSGGVIRLTSYGCGTSEFTNWLWGKVKTAMYGED